MALRFSLSTKSLKLSDVEIKLSYSAAAIVVMARMTASGIWLNADPKDRSLTETLGLIDQLASHLAKIEADAVDLSDVAAIAVSTGFIDAASVLDSAAISVGLTAIDSVAFSEALSFVIQSVLLDTVTTQDQHAIALSRPAADSIAVVDQAHTLFGKQLTDTPTVLDTLERTAQFQRTFADIVSVDDFSQVDKQWSGTKQNVAFTSDLSRFGLLKAELDGITLADSTLIAAQKVIADTTALSETFHLAQDFVRSFADMIALSDSTDVLRERALDESDNAATNDFASFTLGQTHTDSALIGDAYAYAASKVLTDSVGSVDAISIQLNSGYTPVFNGFTFNSNTFG